MNDSKDVGVSDVECDNIIEVVENVFSKPPPQPYSYRMQIVGSQTQHDIFRTLGQFLTHGIVYLYGNTDITTLTPSQIDTLQQYIKAFGWKAIINPILTSNHPLALPYMLKIPVPNNITYVTIIFEPAEIV
jgi:hypothetical protein